jgi:hypothetical protein
MPVAKLASRGQLVTPQRAGSGDAPVPARSGNGGCATCNHGATDTGSEDLAAAPELLLILAAELQTAWREASHTRIVNHVESCAIRVVEPGLQHRCAALEKWGKELRERIERLEIEEAEQMLAEFPLILAGIQAHNKKEAK